MTARALLVGVLLLGACGTADMGVSATHRLSFTAGVCSATAVGRHTLLTAAHCFEAFKHPAVDGIPVQIFALIKDGNDHTLAIVSASFFTVARLGRSLRVGEHIHYWGQPAGLFALYREGYISGTEVEDNKTLILVVSDGFFGDSGAGVFNPSGQLVGVMSVLYQNTQGAYLKFSGMYPLAFTAQQWERIR